MQPGASVPCQEGCGMELPHPGELRLEISQEINCFPRDSLWLSARPGSYGCEQAGLELRTNPSAPGPLPPAPPAGDTAGGSQLTQPGPFPATPCLFP